MLCIISVINFVIKLINKPAIWQMLENSIFAGNKREFSAKIIQRMLLFIWFVKETDRGEKRSNTKTKKTTKNKLASLDLRWITENKSTTSLHTQPSNTQYSMLHNAPIHQKRRRCNWTTTVARNQTSKSNKQIELKRSQRISCPRKQKLFPLKSYLGKWWEPPPFCR